MNSVAPDLTARVRQVFVEALTIQVPSVDTDLVDTGLLDSLALVELLFAIEQRFGVDLSLGELDIENFRTVERIAAFLATKLPADDAAAASG
jgi:D-alanine--poly(phosphoribitol) ligase subunit 2